MEILLAADKAVKELFGPKKEAAAPVEKKKDEKPAAKLPDQKTLTDIPAEIANDTEGAFARLDKLTGEDYENALAALPERLKTMYLDDSRPKVARV